MTEAEIIAGIRRGIFQPSPRTIGNTAIATVILRGVTILGLTIKECDPSFFDKRIAISSNTHVFPYPSNCVRILKIWDMLTTSKVITEASAATPIVVTAANHGFSTNNIVVVHDVVGNTDANGTWKIRVAAEVVGDDGKKYKCISAHTSAAATKPITGANYATYWEVVDTGTDNGATWATGTSYTSGTKVIGTDNTIYNCILDHTAASTNKPVTGERYATYWKATIDKNWVTGTAYVLSEDNVELYGSSGSSAWTSGGRIFKEPTDLRPIRKINVYESWQHNERAWYPRDEQIVIDDISFENDLIVSFSARPAAITDIPAEYHEGLINFGVTVLIEIPDNEDKSFMKYKKSLDLHSTMYGTIIDDIKRSIKASSEPEHINDEADFESFLID